MPQLQETECSRDLLAPSLKRFPQGVRLHGSPHLVMPSTRAAVRALIVTLALTAGVSSLSQTFIAAQATLPSFKVAFYNIQGGKGERPLPGIACPFTENANCSDPTRPLNAWGLGIVQAELVSSIRNDPAVVALGLAEAWACGNAAAVQDVLDWADRTDSHNGLALLARYGFAGPEEWLQLDTSHAANQKETRWVVRAPVCLDEACSRSVMIFATHADGRVVQTRQTLAFMAQVAPGEPRVLVGDLNAWAGTQRVCGQRPRNRPPQMYRAAGYVDAWAALHGANEGYTGMWNRTGCGAPEGYLWKRIDYAWSRWLEPVSMTRFGMVQPGQCAPSDHAGIIAEYAASGAPVHQEGPIAAGVSPDPGDANEDDAASDELQAALQVAGPVDEIVLHAIDADTIVGNWTPVRDPNAASGMRMQNVDLGVPKVTTPAANPADYVELTFMADAGKPYRLWIRGRAERDSYFNDSVYVQFDNAVDAEGRGIWRIGTTSATTVIVEDCLGCLVEGWGWQDNRYGTWGAPVVFASSGPQRLRIQVRQDGFGFDQVVLSAVQYMATRPGLTKNDVTLLERTMPEESR